eukprot:jgi/Picsp_1/1773/NSC_05245-R1_---NA---
MNRLETPGWGGEISYGLNDDGASTTTTTTTTTTPGILQGSDATRLQQLQGRNLKAVYYPGYTYYDDYYFPVWGWVILGIVIFCVVALLLFLFHRQRQRRLQRLQQQQQQQMAAIPPAQQYPPSEYPSNVPPPDYGPSAVATGYPVGAGGENQAGGSTAGATNQPPVWFSGGKPPEYAVTGQPVQRY